MQDINQSFGAPTVVWIQNGMQNGTQPMVYYMTQPGAPANQHVMQIAVNSNSPITVYPGQLSDCNGKTKESDTNVYINRTPLSDFTDERLKQEIDAVCRQCDTVQRGVSWLTLNDFPKITFPKKDGYKKKYLFVDFETTEQPEVGKAIAREFINDFNSKFRQLGHVLAECAKEKDQDENNIYFEPLPYGTTKDMLQTFIANALHDQFAIPIDFNKWSFHVKITDDAKLPVGFCRIESGSCANIPDVVTKIICKMNRKSWAALKIPQLFPILFENPLGKHVNPTTTLLVVKKANRSQRNQEQGRPLSHPFSSASTVPMQCVANPPYQYQPQPQSPGHAMTSINAPQMSQLCETKLEPSYESYQPSYHNQLGNGQLQWSTPRNTMHDNSYPRQTVIPDAIQLGQPTSQQFFNQYNQYS